MQAEPSFLQFSLHGFVFHLPANTAPESCFNPSLLLIALQHPPNSSHILSPLFSLSHKFSLQIWMSAGTVCRNYSTNLTPQRICFQTDTNSLAVLQTCCYTDGSFVSGSKVNFWKSFQLSAVENWCGVIQRDIFRVLFFFS